MGFTDNQIKAIKLRGRDILVSAAAGSGKTSVLVERIIKRICDDDPHVDVDRLLIMTFTNAAAAEMKSRIRDAIDERLEDAIDERLEDAEIPGTEGNEEKSEDYYDNLHRQSVLVHNAKITTIHGFCQSIIRDHFEEIGIDPNFRVGDENECSLMRIDAVDECLEKAYSKADPAFLKAVEAFSGNKSDGDLAELILDLYKFADSYPDPVGFLDECSQSYKSNTPEEFNNTRFVKDFMRLCLEKFGKYRILLNEAIELINETPAIEKYRDMIEAFTQCVEEVISALDESDYDKAASLLKSFAPDRMKTIRSEGLSDTDIEARERVKEIRGIVKKGIDGIAADFADTLDDAFETMRACKDEVEALCVLTAEFGELYSAKKRDKNIIDFGDMEHMAIRILRSNPEIAAGYRELFEEIYIDEYQDSNLTQETLVNLIRRESGNVFCVGDVKQSIYRFRMARPDLFIEKYDNYTDEDSKHQRIILNDNFRSRREVVDAVNEIFSAIMKKELGKIEYDEKAALKYGAGYYDVCTPAECESKADIEAKSDYRAEIVLGSPVDLSDKEFQANVIANRINAMIKGRMQVYDKKKEALRDIRYSDFAILLRGLKGWETPFRRVLQGAGIPVSVTGSEGYFDTIEVRTALAFLSIVDNPYQDIPFAAVMRSQIGGFSDVQMAKIFTLADKTIHKSLYEKVLFVSSFEDFGEEDLKFGKEDLKEIAKLCRELLELVSKYRDYSEYLPVADVLSKFIDEEYGDFLRLMNNGVQRMANINMLLAKAEAFGQTSYKGLYNFVRYMDQIRKYEMDFGEAGILGENDNVVRIMTIHKSKGLEFPVCFVAGIEKGRNTKSERAKVVLDATYGLGCEYTDVDRRIKKNTLLKSLIKDQLKKENLAEEMRVLYVAMTRAREKLIMVGTYNDDSKNNKNLFENPPADVQSCSSYVGMLSYVASCNDMMLNNFDISYETEETLLAGRMVNEIVKESGKEAVLRILRNMAISSVTVSPAISAENSSGNASEISDRLAELNRRLDFVYPYKNTPQVPAKLSVSDLKHRAIEEKRAAGEELTPDGVELFKETRPDKYIPKFMREEGQTEKGGTFYGTAFHRILELWEYEIDNVSENDVKSFAGRMLDKNRLDEDQANAIRPADIAFFLNSDLGKRMKAAKASGNLFREQPFVIGVDATLIQGIIDAYFIEDDGITIVDYKTDYVTDADMLVARYKTQLEYYGKALSQITGRNIKALTIYSSKLRKEIVV